MQACVCVCVGSCVSLRPSACQTAPPRCHRAALNRSAFIDCHAFFSPHFCCPPAKPKSMTSLFCSRLAGMRKIVSCGLGKKKSKKREKRNPLRNAPLWLFRRLCLIYSFIYFFSADDFILAAGFFTLERVPGGSHLSTHAYTQNTLISFFLAEAHKLNA